MTPEAHKPLRVFCSYSRKDEGYLNDLRDWVHDLERQGLIEWWHDREIVPGREYEKDIDKNLRNADIILLLVSPTFMASDYVYAKEVSVAVDRHERGEACVIPIIVRRARWEQAPFAKLQALPEDAKPVATWLDKDEAWYSVAEGIERAIEALLGMSPDEQSLEALKRARERSIEIALDRTNNFSGGGTGAKSIAYQLTRPMQRGMTPVQFELKSGALDTAMTRLAELQAEADRSPDQEEEFNHLLKVRDETDDRLQVFQKALDLAINNSSFGHGTFLAQDDKLEVFLMGLRDQLFGSGSDTPLLPGISYPKWVTEVPPRRHTWYVWWTDGDKVFTTTKVDDAAVAYVGQHKKDAEGLYKLHDDTLLRIVLPAIAVYLVKNQLKDPKTQPPPTIFDFKRWSFSPYGTSIPGF